MKGAQLTDSKLKRIVKVKQLPEQKIPVEIMAESIKEISDGIKKMRSGKLTDRAIILLIHDHCNVSFKDIKSVMDSMQELSSIYLKK